MGEGRRRDYPRATPSTHPEWLVVFFRYAEARTLGRDGALGQRAWREPPNSPDRRAKRIPGPHMTTPCQADLLKTRGGVNERGATKLRSGTRISGRRSAGTRPRHRDDARSRQGDAP